ncbi:hypothetical protein GCM10009425_49150 [Pseudomonas asuensis]|uniref:Uncharacterized protein n=1 Tax=Pseudomonas asuensis TaxID=1825787 RepID=A0ABQ2H3R6_9PSED|nr:hypothetical protein GCM10009425_49150 [Pseudomonas asuensis]
MSRTLKNPLHTSSFQASSTRHTEETQKIGEYPLSALQARVKASLEGHVTNTFNQATPGTALVGVKNLVMLCALQAVNGVLRERWPMVSYRRASSRY